MASTTGKLTVQQLRDLVGKGEIDTVLVAITDMQGRLQGKRCGARYFLEEVVRHGTEGCNYLLAVDVDMNTVDGYAMSARHIAVPSCHGTRRSVERSGRISKSP